MRSPKEASTVKTSSQADCYSISVCFAVSYVDLLCLAHINVALVTVLWLCRAMTKATVKNTKYLTGGWLAASEG